MSTEHADRTTLEANPPRPSWSDRLRRLLTGAYSREIMLTVLIVVLVAAYYARHPKNFPPVRSPATFFNNLAADGVLAVGMMLLHDRRLVRSVGRRLFALGRCVTGWLIRHSFLLFTGRFRWRCSPGCSSSCFAA